MNDPLFRSAEHALRFAFEMQTKPILDRFDVSSGPSNTSGGRWSGLGRHELHAQAAMIRAMVERLPAQLRDYLVAFYQLQVEQLTNLAVAAESERLDAYRAMVEQYCGLSRGGINQIRRLLKVRKQRALEERRRFFDELDRMHHQALDAITLRMREMGIISDTLRQ